MSGGSRKFCNRNRAEICSSRSITTHFFPYFKGHHWCTSTCYSSELTSGCPLESSSPAGWAAPCFLLRFLVGVSRGDMVPGISVRGSNNCSKDVALSQSSGTNLECASSCHECALFTAFSSYKINNIQHQQLINTDYLLSTLIWIYLG